MTDATLALMGVCLGIGSAIGWAARDRWQRRNPSREERLSRWMYRHVDEVLGATKYENQLRADRRFQMNHPRFHLRQPWRNWRFLIPKKLRQWLADYLWPIPRLAAGSNPLPSDQRIRQYVWTDGPGSWWFWYSPEAPANWPQFEEWLTRGRLNQGGGVAMALGLEWRPDLFEVERDYARRLVHLTLTRPAAVPDELLAHEELA